MVFCSECTWYREQRRYLRASYPFVRIEETCLHPRALYATAVRPTRHTPRERNALNDCADFRPLPAWVVLWRTYAGPASPVMLLWILLGFLLYYWSRHLR